jgi:hypothetical protein
MRRTKITHVGAACAALSVSIVASADVLYRNTGTGVQDSDVFSADFSFFSTGAKANVAVVDDGTLGVANAPYSLTSINLGVNNLGETPAAVDVLVQFYDTATYIDPPSSPIATTPIGPQFRFSLTLDAGGGTTGALALSGVTLPDNTYAVVTQLVNPGTTTNDQNFEFLYKYTPVDVGSSNKLFGADFTTDGTILRNESLQWDPDANQFLEIDGVVAPEPAALSVLFVGAYFLTGRRLRTRTTAL